MYNKMRQNVNGKDAIVVTNLGKYNLADTLECGQCFRYERVEGVNNGTEYIIVVKNVLINVGQYNEGELVFYNITDEDFASVAAPFFALDTDLDEIKRDIISRTDSEWLKEAAEAGVGIAILKQDPWEALFSFIISQNNNIPRIRKIIKSICSEYGVNLSLQKQCILGKCATPCEENCKNCGVCYTFPTPTDIVENPDGLLPSKPGFRFKYLLDAANRVKLNEINLEEIEKKNSYDYTLEQLKKIKGVGDKVASCAALFGFGNLEAFPIDVWMKRAIDVYFGGVLDPTSLGKYAGVAQQYIFNYIRNTEADK